jgi:hypothetical protein
MTQPVEAYLVCPYCGKQEKSKLTLIYPSLIKIQCKNPSCTQNWHQGVFGASMLKVGQQTKRGLGKNKPTIYTIRFKDNSGGEHLIEIKTRVKGIMMKKGDIIILTHGKKSKGIFNKEWTGEWKQQPERLINETLNTHWKIT